MKKYLLVLIGIILYSFSNGQIKTANNGINNSLIPITEKQSDLIFDKTKSFPDNTELSIAIIKKGKIKYLGIKRKNDTIIVTENYQSIFEIGSITKVFTATLLSDFCLENELKLEDPIQNYLDFKIKVRDNITFKELANHTSGLPRLPSNLNISELDSDNPYKKYESKRLLEYLTEKIELNQKPGIKYEYSNLGAGIMGFVLSKISKTSFEELLQKNIFTKYGMSNSTTQINSVKGKIVKGLNFKGEETPNWDFKVLAGAGAILSSAEDLSKFALAQFNKKNKELILTQKITFKINETMGVGLGWHILNKKNGEKILCHNGGTGGYSSSIALNTKKKEGIIILSNVSAFSKQNGNIEKLCFGLMETLNKK